MIYTNAGTQLNSRNTTVGMVPVVPLSSNNYSNTIPNTVGYTGNNIMGANYMISPKPETIVTHTEGAYKVSTVTTAGENLGWVNPHNLKLPLIGFQPTCKKCHGSGACHSMFGSDSYPCKLCYTRAGYCRKCFGTAVNYKKGTACTNCKAGKQLKRAL